MLTLTAALLIHTGHVTSNFTVSDISDMAYRRWDRTGKNSQDPAIIDKTTQVENLPMAIFLLGRDRKVLLSNQMAEKIQRADPPQDGVERFGDIIGCPNVDENDAGCGFSKRCHICRVKTMIDQAFFIKKSIAPFETDLDTHSNGVRNLKLSVTYINDEQLQSKQEMCIVAVEDITELKKKERLEAASETIGAICHEMNQPLQAIIGNAALLTKFQLEEGAISKIENIFSQVERIKIINTKLMNLARYQSRPYLSTNILDIEKSAVQPSLHRRARWTMIVAHIAKKASFLFRRTAPKSSRNKMLQPPGRP
jgi:nitrogen fixation/metabolism regulation signal transduction histidine kinase